MAADDFFNRWSKRKAQAEPGSVPDVPDMKQKASAEPKPLPTMADVEQLSRDSDYSRFMARDVDESVRRSAMKKLFSDPHFNVMDGLDIYIDDYGKPDPIPPAMLAALAHARGLLDPLAEDGKPLMRLIDPPARQEAAAEPSQDSSPSAEQAGPLSSASPPQAAQPGVEERDGDGDAAANPEATDANPPDESET